MLVDDCWRNRDDEDGEFTYKCQYMCSGHTNDYSVSLISPSWFKLCMLFW